MPPVHEFEATADTAAFKKLAARFIPEVLRVEPFATGTIHIQKEAQ